MNRTQIYLDNEQTTRLDELAAAEGTSRSMVIRRAVDAYLSGEDKDSAAWKAKWEEALDESAGIAPYLAEGAEYAEETRHQDAERLARLSN